MKVFEAIGVWFESKVMSSNIWGIRFWNTINITDMSYLFEFKILLETELNIGTPRMYLIWKVYFMILYLRVIFLLGMYPR